MVAAGTAAAARPSARNPTCPDFWASTRLDELADGRPLIDVDDHPLVDHMFVDRWPVDHPADRDELLTGLVRTRADTGDQQRARRHVRGASPTESAPATTGGGTLADPRPRYQDQGTDQQQDHREFDHATMVGMRA